MRILKDELIMRPITLTTLLLFAIQVGFMPGSAVAQSTLKVPGGTSVVCEFVSSIDPATVAPGQLVHLRVVNDVIVGGVTVIKAGAAAQGEVTIAEKQGAIGKPAKVGVIVRTIEAVDGTRIPVTGMSSREGESKQTEALVVTILCCILGLIMKGGATEIAAGTSLTVQTLGPAEVSVENVS